jgi:hypothetical protein
MHQIKKDHDARAFSFFSNVTDTKPFRNPARKSNANPVTVSLFWFVHHIKKGEPFADNKDFKTIIEQIRSEPDPAKKTKLKKQLPCVSLSQICDPESRKTTKSFSQLLQIDIDIKDNIDMFADAHKVTAIREKLAKDPFIVLACKSPSNALKCVIHYDSKVVTITDAHKLATAYFFDVYGLVIDKNCKDATRLFFATYDPEIHYNKKAKTLVYKYPFDADKPRFDVDLTYTPIDIPEFDDDVLTFDVGISIVDKKAPLSTIDNEPKHNTPDAKTPTFDIDHIFEQIDLQQIDLTHDYSDWLNFGFCFARIRCLQGLTRAQKMQPP